MSVSVNRRPYAGTYIEESFHSMKKLTTLAAAFAIAAPAAMAAPQIGGVLRGTAQRTGQVFERTGNVVRGAGGTVVDGSRQVFNGGRQVVNRGGQVIGVQSGPTYQQPTFTQGQPTYQQQTFTQGQPVYQQPTFSQGQPVYQSSGAVVEGSTIIQSGYTQPSGMTSSGGTLQFVPDSQPGEFSQPVYGEVILEGQPSMNEVPMQGASPAVYSQPVNSYQPMPVNSSPQYQALPQSGCPGAISAPVQYGTPTEYAPQTQYSSPGEFSDGAFAPADAGNMSDRMADAGNKRALGVYLTSDANRAVIDRVEDGSPAADAGLQDGDVITAVNGQTVNSRDQFISQIGQANGNQPVQLDYTRDGESMNAEANLAGFNDVFAANESNPSDSATTRTSAKQTSTGPAPDADDTRDRAEDNWSDEPAADALEEDSLNADLEETAKELDNSADEAVKQAGDDLVDAPSND